MQNNVSISQSTIGNLHVHTGVVNIQHQSTVSPSENAPIKKSINNFRQPPKDFVECKTFIEVKEKLKSNQFALLHLHGFPGSGKTAIVRKLAAKFPFNKNEKVFIKYMIECSDSSEDTRESLKKLLKEMHQCNLLHNKADCDIASERLDAERTAEFVELLEEASVPTLIIIEDPPETDCNLLSDLMSSISSKNFTNKLHIIITSQTKTICDFSQLPCSEKVRVDGLTNKEGLQLLGISSQDSETETNAAKKVIGELHGSPLGLIAVKATCQKSRMPYHEYGQFREFNHNKEILHLKEELGPHAKHLYQAVVTLLDEKGLWDTMKILSFFHHGGIPQRLIGNIKQMQRNEKGRSLFEIYLNNKQESGVFISRLEDFAVCEVDGSEYHDTTITLHQVIFLAVQTYMKEEERWSAMRTAVSALSSNVHKDIRKRVSDRLMRSMIPHGLSLLCLTDSYPNASDDFVLSMAVAHLQEVYGITVSSLNPEAAEKSLTASACTIWNEVCKRSGKVMDFSLLVNQQNESAEKVVEPIVGACIAAGEHLQSNEDCLDEYIALVTQFKDDELDFLTSLSKDPAVRKILKTASKYLVGISPDDLRKLRLQESGKICLDIASSHRVFFVDRLASIFHTLGRLALYDKRITQDKLAKFFWICDVAHALCVLCKKQTNIQLLFLHLSATARVSLNLLKTSAMEDEQRKSILTTARSLVEKSLNKNYQQFDDVFYENGLRKSVVDDAFNELRDLRSIVRINTKLLKLCPPVDLNDPVKEYGHQYYERFCVKAREYLDKWNFSMKSLVYCGKYMAALGKYEQAVEHFCEVLEIKGVFDDRKSLFPWVCYNYARATVVGKVSRHKSKALAMCDDALKSEDITEVDLSQKLNEQRDLLANM